MNMFKNAQVEADVEAIAARVREAVEGWYAKHYHRSVTQGTPAISSDEKEELHRVVASAVQPQQPAPAKVSAPEQD